MESILTKSQKKKFSKKFMDGDREVLMTVTVRYDDECGNGHNSFSIIGSMVYTDRKGGDSWGCLHDDIAKYFPELAHLIKWHLCGSQEPMYYLDNTIYLAGNLDCNGRAAGEVASSETKLRFGDFPISFDYEYDFIAWLYDISGGTVDKNKLKAVPVEHKKNDTGYSFQPKYTIEGYNVEWYQCPFDTKIEAEEFLEAFRKYPITIERVPTSYSKGKERELDKARHTAIWPGATDEELSLPADQLKEKLLARLPALMTEFKSVVESLGFVY